MNSLPAAASKAALLACCGSAAWARGMLSRLPFESDDALYESAERVWRGLDREDWLAAFRAHLRIGDREQPDSSGWSAHEQSGTGSASSDLLAALQTGNHEYEARFGHVFLVCATGKSAEEMLGSLRKRMSNDPSTELHVAAAEQAKITRLRLDKLTRP